MTEEAEMRVLKNSVCLALMVLLLSAPAVIAQEQVTFFIVKQGEFSTSIAPVTSDKSAVAFYNFSNDQSNTGLEIDNHSLLFLYRDKTTGALSLIVILDKPASGTGGEARLEFGGLPSGAALSLRDDPNDQYTFSPPTASASWRWLPEHNDGLVINNLGEEFEIIITPNFVSGIESWDLLSQENAEIKNIPLPSLTEPVTILATKNAPPKPDFTFSPPTVNINVPVTFDARASVDPDGQIVKYEWDFDGDGVFEVSTVSPVTTHTFTRGGEIKVSLRVTDDKGATATLTKILRIAEEVSRAVRTISTPQALPGFTFRVTVEIQVRTPVNGLGLDEDLPPGWEVTPIENNGATFKGAQTQWVFPQMLRANEIRRIVYDVTVPEAAALVGGSLPQVFEITGFLDSASPAFRIPVIGESQIEAVSCLSIPVAIAHLDLDTDTINLRLPNTITPDQLQQAIAFWLEGAEVPGTCKAVIDLATLRILLARQLAGIPVNQPVPEILEVGARATRRILAPLPFQQLFPKDVAGNRFKVRLEIRADKDINGLVVAESLPQRWEVSPLENSGAVFKAEAREWAFIEKIPAGAFKAIVYEVTVPRDEPVGKVMIEGEVSGALPRFETDISGDKEIEVVECLTVPVAIAHLDVEKNVINVTLDNKISFDQIQAAIAFWLEDEAVPGTCGKSVDFRTIQQLIAFWLTDTPVDKPIPGPKG